jgi:hypothetical protein
VSHKATIKHGSRAMTMQGDVIKKIHDIEKVKPSSRNMMNMRNHPSSKPIFKKKIGAKMNLC